MDDTYYSLDQLLAENQKIPCVFNITVPGMGYLEGTNERDIQPYTPIEIPYWLASILSQQEEDEDDQNMDDDNHAKSNYLTIQIPKAFNFQIRNALSASTKNVNLKNLAANSGGAWYESGVVLLEMIDDHGLKVVLHKTLIDRIPDVMDLSSRPPLSTGEDRSTSTNTTSSHSSHDELSLGLDSWEKEVLVTGQSCTKKITDFEKSKIIS
ncbi:hypothetical protein MJO29_015349 [Puccinia striiformis f. sp. tritici]|uniref:DNA replication complex GINS protein PSF3 n=2 Tax=Puccinia striiformis TaxID=27350 RepID=A0A2S4V0I0_9BASI|nr:hypothetical protein Pst134EB_029626 [Puccinia striiformis f. sp. tritici]KAI7936046.1 hypothetical protein MJO29_015349 [Puccinia striiformis f. sp. tritici]KAI9623387.1 hypothetical protein H4Q26_014554 [Puccinia striiformis f. sp. tritici PST-130]POW03000.1 hypothetical protein PSHT_11869 [Puccinia striiformis]